MQLLAGLQFDFCYIIKTRVGFEIAEMTRFLKYFSSYLFVLVINLKILENSQEYIYSEDNSEDIFYKTVSWEVINVEFLSNDLPVNNSAIVVKWKHLKLLYSSKEMYWINSQSKTWYIWNSWNTLYHFLNMQLVF